MKVFVFSAGFFSLLALSSCGKNDCKEKIKEDCVVTYEFNPVCGCNEKTYDNPSVAACSGIEDYTMGACQ